MKRQFCLLFVVGLIAPLIVSVRAGEKKKSDPAAIYGRIQFVQSFPDYKVKAVTSFPDLKVKIVKSHPGPREWQIVDSSPDFKIKLVTEFPDFTVEFEDGIPEQAKSAD
jgi:hypothetical protein